MAGGARPHAPRDRAVAPPTGWHVELPLRTEPGGLDVALRGPGGGHAGVGHVGAVGAGAHGPAEVLTEAGVVFRLAKGDRSCREKRAPLRVLARAAP